MLQQYTLPEMGQIFSQENRYQLMTNATVTACEALADIGKISQDAYREIKEKAIFDVQRISELEEETGHNTLAFVLCLCERVSSDSARYIHMGLASADISDIATSLQVAQACELLQGRLNRLAQVMRKLALQYKYTLMMGRTHSTHAEPITFGLKLAVWMQEIERSLLRLSHARNNMNVGKVNGAVGSFASVDPRVEMFVCRRLGMQPALGTTQILQRDRLAEFISTLAIIGGSLEKFAIEIRNLQHTEIREVEEFMSRGQFGSSSLPHKRRPYKSEIISGMARLLRGYATSALEDIALWHEQDASHSSVERVIVPDSCILLDYMLHSFTEVMEELQVYPENMKRNIEKSLGLVFSQNVLLTLLEKGVSREDAFTMVRRNAQIAWEQRTDFQFLILEDKEIGRYISRSDIMELFDYNWFLNRIDYIFDRMDLV